MAMKRGRFEEIYRQETQSGKSTLGALASTAAERRREMTDLRRMFPSSGILGAMLESAFGKAYKYKAPGKGALAEKGKGSDSFDAKTMNVIRVNTAITAKNSMVLPGMARDMNVMRQNIVKLTKHTTGAASTRADAFFLKSKERENAYEAQLADKTPQQVKDAGTKKEQKGFFSNLLSSILSLGFKDIFF
jgi:deferrochelatase/peroxidase EfeB